MSKRAALELGAVGRRILPLKDKRPLIPGGLTNATNDLQQIEDWFTRWPDAQIGMKIDPGEIWIDCDPRKGGTFERAKEILGPLPPTLQNVSGRGDGGGHWCYKFNNGPISRVHTNGSGIDILVHNYIVVPDSLHHETGKPYEWIHRPIAVLPEQARRVLTPVAPVGLRMFATPSSFGSNNWSLETLLKELDKHPVQGINAVLHWAAHRACDSGKAHEYEGALVQRATSLGESPRQAQNTYSSALKNRGAR